MAEEINETELFSALSNGMADAVDRIAPSLVLVDGRRRHPASGVVFAPDLVLTADHVLEREEDISVTTYDGRTLPATFVGRDSSSDLAVLRVAELKLTPAAKAQTARVGQFLLADTRKTAKSEEESRPTKVAGKVRPSYVVTEISSSRSST